MLIVGLAFSVFGIGFFCWLLFTLAVYALPFFAGVNVFLAAFHSGAGVIGAIVVGVLAGGATLAIGQIVFATVRIPIIRALIALLYAAPAAVAGYYATLGLSKIGVPSETWRVIFAAVGSGRGRRHSLGTDVGISPAAVRAGHIGEFGVGSNDRRCPERLKLLDRLGCLHIGR